MSEDANSVAVPSRSKRHVRCRLLVCMRKAIHFCMRHCLRVLVSFTKADWRFPSSFTRQTHVILRLVATPPIHRIACPRTRARTRACTCARTRTHAHARTCACARTHVRMHARTHARTHACTHARTHALTRTRARAHTRTRAHTHTHSHTDTRTHAHACTHTRTHTPTRAHAHTHTHAPRIDARTRA